MSIAGLANAKIIESIPPEILKTIPAGDPPPGIQPNFSDPPTLVPALLGVGLAFLVLALVCFIVRIYTKFAISKRWGWDDLTCSLGFACSIVYFGVVINGCINGGNGRHIWDLHLDQIVADSTQDFLAIAMVTPALGLIKCSLFILYYRLFCPWRWARICVWIGATISVAFYASVTVTGFVLSSPWPGESMFEATVSWHYFKFTEFSVPIGVIGMLIDYYLLVLPIRAVLMLQMSPAKKLGVLILFMTGGVAAIASTINLYYRIRFQRAHVDPLWKASYVQLWGQIEMFAGVAVSSMPTLNQFLAHHDFSISSLRTGFRNSLAHLLRRPTREKISDENLVCGDLERGKRQALKHRKAFGMSDLESSDYMPSVVKIPQMENSQIQSTQDTSVAQEHTGV
ncbi:hypothetical protein MMC07_001428 [Pseudocyphellaria aurata]|nr:hypothetical protein [Pseudocyphellaria aurata]